MVTSAAVVAGLWYTRTDGTEVPTWSVRAWAYGHMSAAASRSSDARRAATGAAAGSAEDVARADAWTSLADRRCGHTLALGTDPADMQRDGLLTLDAAVRLRDVHTPT